MVFLGYRHDELSSPVVTATVSVLVVCGGFGALLPDFVSAILGSALVIIAFLGSSSKSALLPTKENDTGLDSPILPSNENLKRDPGHIALAVKY